MVVQEEECCNLTDHIRLPIIHTKTYISINQRQETRTDKKTDYINANEFIQGRELN